MRISLIDDNELVLLVHEKLVRKRYETCEINKYKCPKNYLKDLKNKIIPASDIILSDYNMGKYNGIELLSDVKTIKEELQIPNEKLQFYIVSAEDNLKQIYEECKSAHLKGYFHKPLEQEHLKEI